MRKVIITTGDLRERLNTPKRSPRLVFILTTRVPTYSVICGFDGRSHYQMGQDLTSLKGAHNPKPNSDISLNDLTPYMNRSDWNLYNFVIALLLSRMENESNFG